MAMTVFLSIATIIAIFSYIVWGTEVTPKEDAKATIVKGIIQLISQQGITVVIALIAITVACISFQDAQTRKEYKAEYLNYLAVMFMLIIFMQTISLFIFLPVLSSWYVLVFASYFVIGLLLVVMSLVETYKIVRKTFE